MQDELPARLTSKQLADIWRLTPGRISQFASAGRITKGSDGKFDRDEAMAFRKAQLDQHELLALFQPTRDGMGPKILQHIEPAAELSFEDILGIEPSVPVSPVADARVAHVNAMQQAKLEGQKEVVRRQRLRNDREAGTLISRSGTFRTGMNAGKLVIGILDGIPDELAMVFADPDARSGVRAKLLEKVTQIQNIIFQAVSEFGDQDEDFA